MKNPLYIFLFVMLFASTTLCAQTKLIDSLKATLLNVDTDAKKAKILGDLTWYYRAISTDSSLKYGHQALRLLNTMNDEKALAQQLSDMGAVYLFRGDIDASKSSYLHALKLRRKNKDTLGIAKINANLATIYQQLQQIDSAMVMSIDAMKFFEERGMIGNALIMKSNIANMYSSIKNYDKAIQYHLEILTAYRQQKNTFRQANELVNLGKAYLFVKDTTASITSFEEAIKLAEIVKNNRTLGVAYSNLGNIYFLKNKNKEAIRLFKESLKYRKALNSESEIASLNTSLGLLYLRTGKIALSKNYFSKSIGYYEKNDIPDKLSYIYQGLSLISAYEKNFNKMNYYTAKGEGLAISFYSKEVKEQVVELETKYETAKKEKEILQQKEQILANELAIKNRNLYIVLTSFALLLVALISYGIYRKNQFKRKQLQKELDLKDALATIKTQNRLQEQRLRISRDLHDNIGSQLTFIISSIDNLKFVTKDATPKLKEKLSSISTFTSETIFQLRDTIWAMNKNVITIEDLHTRILSFIEKAKGAIDTIDFKFNQEIEEHLEFSSLKGINIFRVIQEAINNTIKYADASMLEVNISKKSDDLVIFVTDNGKGFDKETVSLGNGLSNIEKRMSEVDGTTKIVTTPGKGTSIQIICKL
ncbi:tetratricopeptide repeat protein [Flavobacteriaceae bacterium S356]|uniref:histidine kinase n=1 Tax=Asprobacillus argus TaxID=3076534 RepID=A0ABU3LB36_9FLAO|nr:tetratricopeptide repeat protein [Flavobacteriaceae bacterium S356]